MAMTIMRCYFVYVNDILSISHHAREAIEEASNYYKAKEGSIKEPDHYLGADIAKLATTA